MKRGWFEGLNPEQGEAVGHNEGPLLILAGAGSGKTTVLVARTGRLIEERIAEAAKVVVLTFTNRAARELKARVASRLGSGLSEGLRAGTFHSFGMQILRRFHKAAGLNSHFGLLDPTDAGAVIKELLRDVRLAGKDAFDVERLLKLMGHWREMGKDKAESDDPYAEMAQVLLPKYLQAMKRLGVVDFDELILGPARLAQENGDVAQALQADMDQLMVDEFQDTNSGQMRLIRELLGKNRNIAVVGDDDQSIYGWRGAEIRNILDFPKAFKPCRVIRLEQNYRSSPEILNMANAVIAANDQRHKKVLKPTRKGSAQTPELFVYENEQMEADEVAAQVLHFQRERIKLDEIAVLYRSNQQSDLLEAALRRNRIPYKVTGGTQLFDRKEIRDALAYLRCSVAPNEVALRRILNVPSRGIGETSVDQLSRWALNNKQPFLQALRRWREAGVSERCGNSIDQFLKLLEDLPQTLLNGELQTNWQQFFRGVGYLDYLRGLYKADGAGKRWETMMLLGRIVDDFLGSRAKRPSTLKEFLDVMELRDVEEDENENRGKVQLLTLHGSKGLEWPVVILMGVEEDLLPHRRLGQDLSEERRLFYVGITRAKSHLVLTRASQRMRHGRAYPSAPSRFLLEIPEGLMRVYPDGNRPMGAGHRRGLLDQLYKKLDENSAKVKELEE